MILVILTVGVSGAVSVPQYYPVSRSALATSLGSGITPPTTLPASIFSTVTCMTLLSTRPQTCVTVRVDSGYINSSYLYIDT